jgi:hypothetical protein
MGRDNFSKNRSSFGTKDSEEYRKLMMALDAAENQRDKVERELDELQAIVSKILVCDEFSFFHFHDPAERKLGKESRQSQRRD